MRTMASAWLASTRAVRPTVSVSVAVSYFRVAQRKPGTRVATGVKGISSPVLPYSLPSVGPGADPGVQAVSRH